MKKINGACNVLKVKFPKYHWYIQTTILQLLSYVVFHIVMLLENFRIT